MSTKLCPFCSEEIKVTAIKCKHCGSMLSGSAPYSGVLSGIELIRQALGDRYEILEEVGRGGMSVVYKAIQRNLSRPVALKVIHQNLLHDQEFVTRFHREAQVCASLSHSNIITVYDEGEVSGVHFMAMEYLEGTDLHELLRTRGKLSTNQVLQYLLPVAEALDYAHQKGLIHRDIKSSNIFITGSGRVVLMDFGIAHAAGSKITVEGTVIGTPEYMSPEQADGRKVDHRTDLYSLGVVMYECLTGRVPFGGENAVSIIHKVIYDPPPTGGLNKAPASLQELIISLLSKTPGDRPGTAAEVATAIRQIQHGKRWLPNKLVDRGEYIKPSEQMSQTRERRKRNPAIVWLLVLMGIVLAVLLVDQLANRASDKNQNGQEMVVDAEDQDWQNAQHANTIASYDGYLQKYANGKYSSQARTRKTELEQQETEQESRRQISGRQRELELERDRQRHLEEQQAQQAEDQAWQRAKNINTVASYDNYLNEYPYGMYASEARTNKGRLEQIAVEASATSGTFTDLRDGKTYKWVKNGSRVWMAENLAFRPSRGNYWAYNNNQDNVSRSGYLYDWDTARRVCPPGWHLPTDAEWTQLTNFVGDNAGTKLKARSGWRDNGNGNDEYGFSAIPGGLRSPYGNFMYSGNGYWWSASEAFSNSAWCRSMYKNIGDVYRRYDFKEGGFNVRCAQDI